MITAMDAGAGAGFHIISNEEFQAFSRSEKLRYLQSAIRAHQRLAHQKAGGAAEGNESSASADREWVAGLPGEPGAPPGD